MHFLIRILRRMAVGQRLATGFGLVLVLMALLIGVALHGLSELHQLNMRLVEQGHVDGSSAKATVAAASSTLYDTLRGAILGIGVLAALVAGFFSRRVAQMITRPISRAAAVADGIARGDLAQKIDVNHHGGELGALLHSLQNTIYRLRELIQAVRDRAEAVNNGTSEIARGNTELSSRTEQQASTLEQTAASIEEFTSSIKQNAENARRAKALAIGTSEIATAGGRAVSNAVDTMNGISTSSKKISDIIGVIDGIAFQTNILALNAAVEAARAGDQGRGFAVVASEVRTLAQRSATAAKEIKVLISDSVEKINAGGTLVTEAGKTMVEVVESVKRMTDMVNQIADASREQAGGIDQVNHAIVHMDQSTQQNAALVEQVSATAQTMTAQVHAMMQAVGAFNLGELVLQPTFERGFRRADEKPDTATTDVPAARASPPVATLPAFVRRVSARDADSGDAWKAV